MHWTKQCSLVTRLTRSIAIAAALLSWAALQTAQATVVREWNEATLAEIRLSRMGPPVAARALAIVHTCIYDAWTAYHGYAVGVAVGGSLRRPSEERTDTNKSTAVSFAAYRCLLNLFPAGQARLTEKMIQLGYDYSNTTTDTTSPIGIGNVAAAAVIERRRDDGSNQYGDLNPGAYSDYTGYQPANLPMPFCLPSSPACPPLRIDAPTRWQPLISDSGSTQSFIAPHWERVRPFALFSANQFDHIPWLLPAPAVTLSAEVMARNVDEMIRFSSELDERKKLIVEYWADGPDSELPPGHWSLFGQFVSQRDHHSLNRDVRMFFVLQNALFDAGIVAWHVKREFDSVRPITAVRNLKQGQTIVAWGGPGRPVEPIPGSQWTPYNPGSNLTPAFPGYISGHSTFSSAGATVLRLFTGSDYFGFSTVIPADFGRVEPHVPPVPTTISFATFSAAAEEAGVSRLYGGIHFSEDNVVGQRLGTQIGWQAYIRAQLYFLGLAH